MRGDNSAGQRWGRRPRLRPGALVVLLVAAAFLPLLALHVYSILQITSEQRLHLEHDVEDMAEAASLVVEGAVRAATSTAQTLSEVPSVRTPDPAVAALTLSRILAVNPQYVNLWAAGPDGAVYATALPGASGAGAFIGDQAYVRQAQETRAPVGHDGRGIPGLDDLFAPLVAAPVLVDSQFGGTVQVAFRLTGLEALPAHVGLPQDGVVTVVDGAGTIVFRSLQPERWVGVNVANTRAYQELQSAAGPFVSASLDGVERLLAASPVAGTTSWSATRGRASRPTSCRTSLSAFARPGAPRERAGGLGLGLYLARGIVEAHGGRIGVVSEPGHGATFWFTLPLNERQVSREPAPALLAQARAATEAEPTPRA